MFDPTPLHPLDSHNRELEANVRPPNWSNPVPTGRYNLVVIGAGTAGLVAAAGAAGLGAKVAIIERSLMGGDCLNVGCVPSKGIISSARVAAAARRAGNFGVEITTNPQVNFSYAMERMRRLRAQISPNDSARRFRDLGIDVFFGQASFIDANTIDVNGQSLKFRKAVIATGARAAAPPIPGLDTVDYLTNESLFSLTELPKRLGVIGAGPIGCEMAQAFAQFGSQVVLIESSSGILPREDRDAAAVLERQLLRDGVRLLSGGSSLSIAKTDNVVLKGQSNGNAYSETVDRLLIAAGRRPNIEHLNLELVGVSYTSKGVTVNDRLQTTNPNIYAAGDICSRFQFTHAADFMARIVIQNAIFKGRKRASRLVIPWCTYTSPEVAHVGLNEKQAEEQGVAIDTFLQEFREVDRAILDSEEEGFVKVHVKRGTDTILGATIVAGHAGDMISELTLAMTNRIGLKQIANTIHPYPTQAEAIRKLGDQYNRTRLTPLIKSIFAKWLAWTR